MRKLTEREYARLREMYRWRNAPIRRNFTTELVSRGGTVALHIGPRGGLSYGNALLTPREIRGVLEEFRPYGFVLVEDRATRKVHVRSIRD